MKAVHFFTAKIMDQLTVTKGKPNGYEKLTVDATARAFTVPQSTTHLLLVVATAKVWWRDDGTDPVSGTGIPLTPGQSLELDDVRSIKNFRAIRDGAASATLHISNYSKDI